MTDHTPEQPDATDARAELRARMREAVALPAQDPVRRDVVRDVLAAGPWAEREWVDLTAADERLRLDLCRVDPPASLQRRLLALPDYADATPHDADAVPMPVPATYAPRPHRPLRLARPLIGMAAALLIGVGVFLALGPLTRPALGERLTAFSAECVDHHLMRMPLIIQTADVGELEQKLRGTVGFDYRVPDLSEQGFTLVGARPCHLRGHDIIQSRWERDGRVYSLYVYDPAQFRLPESFGAHVVHLDEPASDGRRRDVKLWSDDRCAYAIVPEDEGAAI